MKKILMFAIPGVLVVAGLLFFAHSAQSFGFKRPMHRPSMVKDFILFRIDQMGKDLNLNPDQQTRFDSLKDNVDSMIDQRMEKRKTIHELVRDELQTSNPDLTKVAPLIDEQIDGTAQNAHQLVQQFTEFYNTLTPDQKKTLSEKVLEHMPEHEMGE